LIPEKVRKASDTQPGDVFSKLRRLAAGEIFQAGCAEMELTYLYDGSFDGFLSCVFESYRKQEVPTAIESDEDSVPALFSVCAIETNRAHAQRVYRGLVRRSPDAARLIWHGFLTCLPQRELRLYQAIAKLLQDGPGFLCNLADETLLPIRKAVRHLYGEVEHLRGFVRFSEMDGVLGAEIEPEDRVLPLLRGHFCARCQNERFFIYDRTHREVLLYADGRAVIAPLANFQMSPPSEEEAGYRLLWKRFYDTVAIRERSNPKCRRTQMPMRYWNTMTEFQGPEYFKAKRSPAASQAPGAQGGIPAPATLAISAPSAPASAL